LDDRRTSDLPDSAGPRDLQNLPLQADETVVAWFSPDLDSHRQFQESAVVLTTQRLLSGDSFSSGKQRQWNSWDLADISVLQARDRAGLGNFEVIGPHARLAEWFFTVGRSPAAHNLIDQFNALKLGQPPLPLPDTDAAEPESEPVSTGSSAGSLFRLLKFARPRLPVIFLGFLLTLASTGAGLIPPYVTILLVDNVLSPTETGTPSKPAAQPNSQNRVAGEGAQQPAAKQEPAEIAAAPTATETPPPTRQQSFSLVTWYLAAMAGAAVAAWLLSWAQGAVLAWVSERVSADLRNETYAHLQKLSLEFFGGKRTGDLMSRVSNDTDRICTFLSDSLVDFATDVLMFIGTATILLSIDPLLAVATLSPFPLIAWLVYRARNQLQHGFLQGGRAWADMTSVLADTIPGIRVVKAFAQERREVDRFRRSNDRILEANDKVNAIWTFFWPMVVLLNQVGLLVVWTFGAWLVYEHQIKVGVLVGFVMYIGRFYTRLESMSRMVNATQRAAASSQRIFEILDRVPTVPESPHPIHPGRLRGEIEFRKVGFRYGNRQVVEDLNFSIQPGEVIGLVGQTGAGKSTLVNLVCRFYDVGEGAVLVDGVDVRNYSVEEYRHNIGIVLQEPFLFYGTIAENIAYGLPDATRGEIIEAARAARAHDFILRLSDGYDSIVGERGQSLSGGERQRISIARALLINPRILILDEATSAVDTQTEREIQEALDYLIQGRTTIAIAHRLSTLRKANRLVVLEHGRIVEVGHHFELLQKRGAYSKLHHAQVQLTQDLVSV
jgi:ATP-binding cassette subfamily B protein